MLTESTGSAICDSGGDDGRHWQRNQKKTIQEFINEPEAILETYEYKNGQYDITPTISLFHKLTSSLELDDLCNEFNSMSVDNWNSDYYGVSSEGFDWLENLGFKAIGEAYNSYNGDCILSQVIQGQQLELHGDDYILLQIHNGCDVRGGYTDAKLFKLDIDNTMFSEYCSFSYGDGDDDVIDYASGEWINREGRLIRNEDLNIIASKIGKKTIEGGLIVYTGMALFTR
jgi:hypothetical protein